MGRTRTSFTAGDPRAKNGGRKPLPLDVVNLCRQVTREAVEKQIEILRLDAKGDPAIMGVQSRVADSLLNRGWGTAPQVVLLGGETTIRVEWE